MPTRIFVRYMWQHDRKRITCIQVLNLIITMHLYTRWNRNGLRMEYKMLNLFRKNPRQVLTRGQLLEKLWDIDERFVDEHTLTTSISRIRSKIESDGGAPYIKTVYGMGYQWTGGEAK